MERYMYRRLTHRQPLAFALSLAAAMAIVAPSRAALAQNAMDAKSAAFLRQQYLMDMDSLHAKVMALATAIPEDKYSWRPQAGVRSVGEVLGHLAGEWYYYLPQSVGAKPHADYASPRESLPKLEKVAGKQAMLDQLNTSWAYGRAQLAAADPATLTGNYKPWGVSLAQAAFGMTGDQHEHLGQLIAYARANGVKPPWSK
jgi:uncharacterized damage-inducible protein DinB